ncbi:MAG: metallophosphoesterase [Prevotellaceae bacterium]|nr:metallophosphoesterase [Prevotellaceae bacterium]
MFFLTVVAVYLAANIYIFMRGLHALPSGFARLIFALVFALCFVAFFGGMIFEDKMPATLASVLQHIGGTWLISLIYLFAAVLFIDIIRIADHFLHFLPDFFSTQQAKICVFGAVAAAVTAVLVVGVVNFNHPLVQHFSIDTKKSTDNIQRIVVASDLHLGYTIGNSKLNDFVELINKQNPDLVLLCGDVFDRSLRPVESLNMTANMRKIKAKYGVYAILGNHEHYGDPVRVASILADAGIILLRDSVVSPVPNIYLVGRDDFSNKYRRTLAELMTGLDSNKFIVLLDHQPHNLDEACAAGVDIQFSGHTHDGQVFPINLITRLIYEKSYGYYRKGDTHYYITSGLGLWGAHLRIGTNSELVVLTVENKK